MPLTPGDLAVPVQRRAEPGRDRNRRPAGQHAAGRRRTVAVHRRDQPPSTRSARPPDGSIVSPSEQDLTQGVLTQYAPARLVLAPGMQPGVPQTTTLQVNVYNIGDLSSVTHTGTLTLTVTYLGRYQVTVPAGTYPAALVKWQYNGQVGPATVSDVEYRFFADGVGPVAAIDKQDVSAFLVYNNSTKFGKVLTAKTP